MAIVLAFGVVNHPATPPLKGVLRQPHYFVFVFLFLFLFLFEGLLGSIQTIQLRIAGGLNLIQTPHLLDTNNSYPM
jgi:small neutral amino acid transporter SnatA (MarC family)